MASIEDELSGSTAYAPRDWLPTLFSLHSIDAYSANQYLVKSPYYVGGRWDIPDADDSDTDPLVLGLEDPLDRWKYQNDRIQRRFMDIMNDIIHYYHLEGSRKVLTTEPTDDETDDLKPSYDRLLRDPNFSTRPDLALLGQDTRYLPRPLDSYESRMSIEEGDRIELYRGCAAIGKVERHQRRRYGDKMLAKVATCARKCFKAQPGRRFVYCFSVSHDIFRLFLFDRSGAVCSTVFDIHKDAAVYVCLVRFLANPDLVSLGFDPSIYWDQGQRYIDVLSGTRPVKYKVEGVLYRNLSMFGRGTTCWSVREAGVATELFIIKDGWLDDDLASEEEFQDIWNKEDIPGVARLLLQDEYFAAPPLTTSLLRQRQGLSISGCKDRVFTRVVVEQYGQSICHFTSGLHLLQILRDAISALYFLVKAGVLHRNINPDNILIGKKNAPKGWRGILIDLKNATLCERGKSTADEDVPTGVPLFRSVSSLTASERDSARIKHRHDFLDDLESFFWVFAWILMVHDGPGPNSVVSKHCRTVEMWHAQKDHPGHLSASKYLYVANLEPSRACLTPYFSQPLFQRLHDNFRDALQNFTLPKAYHEVSRDGTPAAELDLFPYLETAYNLILAYFDAAILQLQPKASKARSILQAPTRIQPERRGKRSLDPSNSPPPAKRQRVDLDHGSATTKTTKLKRLSTSSAKTRSAMIACNARPLPSNVRRSARLKMK